MRLRRSKYNNRKTSVDGYLFDSAKEARRYKELKLMEKAGAIANLKLQPVFKFKMNSKTMFKYIADFRYYDAVLNREVIEDVKGVKTQLYSIKKKLTEEMYKIKIIEV